jgi:hypothetical protein
MRTFYFVMVISSSILFSNFTHAQQKEVLQSLASPEHPSTLAPRPNLPEIVAISSKEFLSSLGVNTHVDQGYSALNYIAPLKYMGIRNIRDGGRHLSSSIMLHQQAGILVDLVGGDVVGLIAAAKNLAAFGALLSIEGPNEPNNFPVVYQGRKGGGASLQSWTPVAELQRDIYAAVKSDADLRLYPVFHVSEGGAEMQNVGLQFLRIPNGSNTTLPAGTAFADFANVHNYVTGNGVGYVDNQAWQAADPILNKAWDGLYGEYGTTWRGHFQGYSDTQLLTLPRVTTETGWETKADIGSEELQGKILVNTYLAQFKRGWRYTFIYELGEGEGSAANQGLYHKDWTPKVAARYIHNLTTVISNKEITVTPGKLRYAIPEEPITVHDMLIQKTKTLFDIIIWGERILGEDKIALDFDSVHPKIDLYDLTIATSPIQTFKNINRVDLTVSDHALVVEID